MPRSVRIGSRAKAFKKGFKKKSPTDKETVRNALRQMVLDLEHPSLRAKPMTGHKSTWEAHASLSVVMTFDFVDPDTIRLRACCNHDIYRRP